MDERHLHAGPARIPLRDVVVRTSRSSGPGGQHANVTASRVEALVDLRTCGGLTGAQRERALGRLGTTARAVAQEARSQQRNREVALERLGRRIAEALHVQKHRRPTGPSRGARRRRADAKTRRGEVKRARRRPATDD